MYTIKRVSEMVGVPVATLRACATALWRCQSRPFEDSGLPAVRARDIVPCYAACSPRVASGWSPKEARGGSVGRS